MEHLTKFLNSWDDKKSLSNLKKSNRGSEVQKAEIENALKDMAMRYERSPSPNTIKLWASDIFDAGYDENVVKSVVKALPIKFERCPSLKDIVDLLRPYSANNSISESELDRYTRLCLPHVKAKFLALLKQEQLDEMCKIYIKHVYPDLSKFSIAQQEMCILLDWLRSYFQDGKSILSQGLKSNNEHEINNLDYFLIPLKRYAKENKLDDM